jgi:serine/threonine protein kinase
VVPVTATVNTPVAFGDYQVMKLLGAGMQGETYLAADPSGRLVAVKTIPAGTVHPRKARSVLDAEVVTLEAAHPAFAPTVIDYDPDPARPYYVMTLVQGLTLEQYLEKKGRLTDPETLALALRLAALLACLHALGIAHGDFRAQNIIVSEDDGAIYVVDFGRAVQRSESRSLFRKRQRGDLRQLGELIVHARNGRAPFGEDTSRAIEKFSEGLADMGALTGRTRYVAQALLRNRPYWRGGMSARRAHRILLRGRQAKWRFWSGQF